MPAAIVREFPGCRKGAKSFFDARLLTRMRRKIGLASEQGSDVELVSALFATMQSAGANFTLTFRRLAQCADEPASDASLLELFASSPGIADWLRHWEDHASYFRESVTASIGAAFSSDVKSPSSVVSNVASLPSFDGLTLISVFPSNR